MKNEDEALTAQRLSKIWAAKKDALGLSQEKAAAIMGFKTQAAISQFLNGKVPVNIENVLKFAALLKVAPEEIDPSVGPLLEPIRQAVNVTNSINDADVVHLPVFNNDEVLKFIRTGMIPSEVPFVPIAKTIRTGSFWLIVSGHSMTAPQGVIPSFPEGILILIEPASEVKLGEFCIATLANESQITFKKYDHDAGVSYLLPLNAAYRTLRCDESTKILGRVVHAQWPDHVFNAP